VRRASLLGKEVSRRRAYERPTRGVLGSLEAPGENPFPPLVCVLGTLSADREGVAQRLALRCSSIRDRHPDLRERKRGIGGRYAPRGAHVHDVVAGLDPLWHAFRPNRAERCENNMVTS
jgi:hypothetical protein